MTIKIKQFEPQQISHLTDEIYSKAAKTTGCSEKNLRDMATLVFASMLLHAMDQPRQPIWTLTMIDEGQLTCEVDIPERRRRK